MQRWNVLNVSACFSKQKLGLHRRLKVDVEAHSCGMPKDDADPFKGLLGGDRLLAPERGEGVSNGYLLNLSHRH